MDSLQSVQSIPARDAEVIKYLEQAIAEGKHWYIALLEAVGRWNIAEEACNGRTYCYLIDGEAFDWLLLAERLCEAVDGLLPDEEKTTLLFFKILKDHLVIDDIEETGNMEGRVG